MEDNGSPAPLMETDDQCTYFLTVLHINKVFITIDNQVSNQEGNYVSDQVSDQVSDKIKDILTYCKDPRSSAEVLSKIGLSNHTTNYKKHIEPLLEKQLLQMTIPDNPKNRNQKYKTTQKGKGKLNS